ncbi:metalloregulator ArsR/SmtB family transcription factor [Pseudoalteromonas sp. JBTF-M23]|uniref:Metalloregulator ArsR/SmtB family transcription factor n=1 Tax=Pseudoalteromonas caenipelagi TaxID=2726988 RepID=A0A849V8E2_9GAMM|nr:metalloregulator ArsR/SmtB family transcription factor [Pseudoalteromonas caenipelagi]NOU49125.1 metalloregulator ArsR/SmtB family transcription factor [Pseudoalteromonas caenipelagi]
MDLLTFYKALADNTRLLCLLLIEQEQELCVCELMAALELSQPKISRHLAQLKKVGIVTDRKHKQWVYYRINEQLADWVKSVITQTYEHNQAFLQTATDKLNSMGSRPERVASCCNN